MLKLWWFGDWKDDDDDTHDKKRNNGDNIGDDRACNNDFMHNGDIFLDFVFKVRFYIKVKSLKGHEICVIKWWLCDDLNWIILLTKILMMVTHFDYFA